MFYKNKILFVSVLPCFLLSFFALYSCANAANLGPPWGADTIPSDVRPESNELGFRGESIWDFIEGLVGRLASWLFTLGIIIGPLVILIGAFMILTSAGDIAKVQNGRKVIFWTLVILGIVVVARVAISAIRYIVSFH